MRDLEHYQKLAGEMIDADRELRRMQKAMDRMAHLSYELPNRLRALEWVRKYVSSAPYETLRAGTRVLGGYLPQPKIEPISVMNGVDEGEGVNSKAARKLADEWERALGWQFELSASRQGILLSDILRSALLYDEVCGTVVHMPTQLARIKARGGNGRRYAAALRFGDFSVIMRNPQNVHVRYSPYMAEAVLLATAQKPQEVVDFWGDMAGEIKKHIEAKDAPASYVLFHYQDYEAECVWCIPGEDPLRFASTEYADAITIMPPEENEYEFMPTIALRGGTMLDSSPEHQRLPLLYPVYRADHWINTNVIGTLMQSEAIAESGQPRFKVSGPGAENVEVDYDQPGGRVDLPPGHDVVPLPKDGLDPALRDLLDRRETAMQNSTLARILVTAETSPGESFSGFNLRVNQATGSLMPWKQLAERWIAEMFKTELYWLEATGSDLEGYGEAVSGETEAYTIRSEDIDPQRIYLKVNLVPDVPTDRVQKTNAAIMQARDLKRPAVAILEELGVADPEREMEEYWREQLFAAAIRGKLQMIEAQASGQLQQMAEQMAQQMMQQQQQAQQPQGGPQGFEGLPPDLAGALGGVPPDMLGGQGMPGIGGPGFAPPMGGMPPSTANPPGGVREQQTGMAGAGGEPLAGLA